MLVGYSFMQPVFPQFFDLHCYLGTLNAANQSAALIVAAESFQHAARFNIISAIACQSRFLATFLEFKESCQERLSLLASFDGNCQSLYWKEEGGGVF